MGIRKASRAEIPIWSVAELEAEVSEPVVTQQRVSRDPHHEMVTEIVSGDSSQEIAETLAGKILEEKVM